MSSWGKKAVEDAKKQLEDFKKEQYEERAKAAEEAEKYKVGLEKFVGELVKKQWIQESDLEQVESFIRKLPYKGAGDFRLEHKEKKQ